MANYAFKKEVAVYLVYGTLKYRIDINDISFGQSFKENSFPVKTLHNQSGFEASSINQANPADFSFNTPLLKEERHKVVFDRLLDYATFDLYITSGQDVFKLDKCVIQDGTFEINKSKPLRLSISGEASKLSKISGVVPGTLQTDGTTTTTYIVPKIVTLTLGGTDISDSVTALTLEVQNDANWDKYNTIQGAVTATNAATSMFPSTFTIGTRVVAGSITKYLDDSTDLLTWNTGTAMRLKVGTAGTFYGLDFNSTACSFTNRFQDGDVFLEEYSYRMTQRPTTLTSVLTYTTA
jgi:hypothetical protein